MNVVAGHVDFIYGAKINVSYQDVIIFTRIVRYIISFEGSQIKFFNKGFGANRASGKKMA
jgi:hypothetical protein